jgi:hypothetical protein
MLKDSLAAGISALTPKDAASMRDVIVDELTVTGFGTDWEPTERGRLLEELIDRLNRQAAA